MTETGKRIKSLLNTEIKPSVLMFVDCLADWYKISQTIYLQTEILENDLTDQEELLEKVQSKLFILKEDMKTQMQKSGNSGATTTVTTTTSTTDEVDPSGQPPMDKDLQTFPRCDLKTLYNMSCDNNTLVRENEDLMVQLISLIDSKGLLM